MEHRSCMADQMSMNIRQCIDFIKRMNELRTVRELDPWCTIPPELGDVALKIADNMRGEFLVSTSVPKTVASAVVYIAATITGSNMTQKDVCDALNMNSASLRIMCKKIKSECGDKIFAGVTQIRTAYDKPTPTGAAPIRTGGKKR